MTEAELPRTVAITDDEFSRFQKLLHQTAGIYLPPAKKVLVEGRLAKRLRHHGLPSYSHYYRMISDPKHADEFQMMLNHLTTNETYFFREPAHFDFLRQTLPIMPGAGDFRVWSAACSSGEEVYTLAMVLDEALPRRPWEVIGSDLSTKVLAKARQGLYPLERATGIERRLLQKYCLKGVRSQEGFLLIDPSLRRKAQFRQLNLTEPLQGMGAFDIIFLRNVLIYFDPDTKRDVVNRVVQQLKPGGYFFISHSESLHGITDMVKMVRPSVFQRLSK
jgi:chemotaxis protein methyltransferase CheR